jgi:hypothetical protein
MPKPERRMGTREMVSGRMVLVGYSYPRWLLVCLTVSCQTKSARLERGSTGGPSLLLRPEARASQPSISEISCTSAFVSRGLVALSLSWESLAWRQGCVETWTFGGRD